MDYNKMDIGLWPFFVFPRRDSRALSTIAEAVALIHRDADRPGKTATEIAAMPLEDWLSIIGLLKGMGAW